MKYFSGFSLWNEKTLFDAYLPKDDISVAGFSHGAQKAFEYACKTKKRVDRLVLISPAFFQIQKESFIRTQLLYYKKNKTEYIRQFLQNCAYPSNIDISKNLKTGTEDELYSLLTYKWEKRKIEMLLDKGIVIEVFWGSKDKIVDTIQAQKFFSKATCYTIKDAGHLLKGEEI